MRMNIFGQPSDRFILVTLITTALITAVGLILFAHSCSRTNDRQACQDLANQLRAEVRFVDHWGLSWQCEMVGPNGEWTPVSKAPH